MQIKVTLMDITKQTFSREELYSLVWSQPLSTLAKKYNISDVGLRKICNRMTIPLPNSGHWHKLRFGKQDPIKPLPKFIEGEQSVRLAIRTAESEKEVEITPLEQLTKEIEESKFPLSVPTKLYTPEKLIVAAKEHLEDRKNGYIDRGLIKAHRGFLDINVSPNQVHRALLFFDTLIKALKARGHKVLVNDSTYAVVDNEELKITLREKTNKTIVKGKHWDSSEFNPSGIFIFKIDVYPEWESKDGRELIEKMIAKIVAKLELKSKEVKQRRQERVEAEQKRQEKDRLEREAQKKRDNELADFKLLLQKAKRWNETKLLREYVKEVELTAERENPTEDIKEWIAWARNKINWYDPLIEQHDELFDKVDKETLEFKKSAWMW